MADTDHAVAKTALEKLRNVREYAPEALGPLDLTILQLADEVDLLREEVNELKSVNERTRKDWP